MERRRVYLRVVLVASTRTERAFQERSGDAPNNRNEESQFLRDFSYADSGFANQIV